VRDAVEFERLGKPTITLAHEMFAYAARAQAKALGMPSLPILVEPAPPSGNLPRDVRAVAEEHFDEVLRALTQPAPIPTP
jgi:hypothetical protein